MDFSDDRRFDDSTLSIMTAIESFEAVHGKYLREVQEREEVMDPNKDDILYGRVPSAIWAVYRDRRIFRTSKGYLGIGPSSLDKGDVVMLVAGVEIPFIFRPLSGRDAVSLVGAAYVHGIMTGEAMKELGSQFKMVAVV
jgi:hypothetical protein